MQKTGNYQFGCQNDEGLKGPPFVAAKGVSCKTTIEPRKDNTALLGHAIRQKPADSTLHKNSVVMVRVEAIVWIINNQLGKRNISKFDRITLEDKMQGVLAKQAKKNIGGDHKSEEFQKSKDKNSCPLISRQEKRENSTDYKIAKAADTSEDTGHEKAPFYTEKAPTYSKKVPCASCCGVPGKHFLSLVLDSARNLSGFVWFECE